jgi:hypothetical protein
MTRRVQIAVSARVGASGSDGSWDQPGLGSWTIRELAAHANRGQTTVEQYLRHPQPPQPPGSSYFTEEAIAARGREAVLALAADSARTCFSPSPGPANCRTGTRSTDTPRRHKQSRIGRIARVLRLRGRLSGWNRVWGKPVLVAGLKHPARWVCLKQSSGEWREAEARPSNVTTMGSRPCGCGRGGESA